MRPLFVHFDKDLITAETFKKLIISKEPNLFEENKAYHMFMTFLDSSEGYFIC